MTEKQSVNWEWIWVWVSLTSALSHSATWTHSNLDHGVPQWQLVALLIPSWFMQAGCGCRCKSPPLFLVCASTGGGVEQQADHVQEDWRCVAVDEGWCPRRAFRYPISHKARFERDVQRGSPVGQAHHRLWSAVSGETARGLAPAPEGDLGASGAHPRASSQHLRIL